MTLRRTPKRLPGDHALLRRAYVEEQLAEFETHFGHPLTDGPQHDTFTRRLAAHPTEDFGEPYRAWLTMKGIDLKTGKMTEAGLAFFEQLVADQNARNRDRRHGRSAA